MPPTQPRSRARSLLIAPTLILSWYAMMAVHEFGHVLNAWLSGGRVARVVIPLLDFSRTDLAQNPHPLIVAAGGVFWGALIPVLFWLVARAARLRCAFLLRFFAGFCLIATGGYLAGAIVEPVADAADLVRLGVPRIPLAIAGIALLFSGLALCHNLGAKFGLARVMSRAPDTPDSD